MRNAQRRCFVAAVALMIFTAGCAALQVHSYIPRGEHFTGYRTYAWAHNPDRTTGDARFDNNQIFADRLRADVARELAHRGLEPSGGNAPDLLVRFFASFSRDVDPNGAGEPRCDDCRPFTYEAGTLLLDLVDARSGRLVWRGWAESRVDGVADEQERMEEEVDRAIVKILAQLPARS